MALFSIPVSPPIVGRTSIFCREPRVVLSVLSRLLALLNQPRGDLFDAPSPLRTQKRKKEIRPADVGAFLSVFLRRVRDTAQIIRPTPVLDG